MSASTERKNRLAARAAGTDKKQLAAQEAAEKSRKTRRKWIIGTVAVVLCIALVLFLSSPVFYRITKAETVGSKTFSPAEVNYYKASSGYSTYTAYFGEETARAMLERNLAEISAQLDYAKEQGLSLSTVEKDEISQRAGQQMDQFADIAKENGVSTSTYMSYVFGSGVNERLIRSIMEDSVLAQKGWFHRYCGLQYSAEELDAYYANPEDADSFDYAVFFVAANEERTALEARAAAQAVWMSYQDGKDEGEPLEVLNDILAEELPGSAAQPFTGRAAGSVDEAYRAWITDPARTEGELGTVEQTDGSGVYLLLFLGRSDNTEPVVAVRHILIKAEADENGAYSDEAKDAARERAEELLAAWEAGDKTEADFALMAYLFSEDSGSSGNGGLYSNVTPGQMVEEFDAFCFAEGRQYGDTAIVYGESGAYAGYHIMFYVESLPARQATARDALRSEAMTAWTTEITAELTPEYHWAYKLVKK
jgi:parvulin-like peptidyl-prolyl isomerase